MDIRKYQNEVEKMKQLMDVQSGVVNFVGSRKDLEEKLNTLVEKSAAQKFQIMVMGMFSSGKSSMINAFLGEKILPTKALPATALITEIKYGPKPKITVYPRKNGTAKEKAPFSIDLKDLKKYCLINHKESQNVKIGDTIQTPYEKVEVIWPLEMIREGVVIVDSPGLNDPYSNDLVTKEYLPNADAIIFCINATVPYGMTDREALEDLRIRGFQTPIFVITRFDSVTEEEDEDGVAEFVETTERNLKKHSELLANASYQKLLGGKGIHFVNSLQGLEAKKSGDVRGLKESGYQGLEDYLEKYLVEFRGEQRLKVLRNNMRSINTEIIQTLKEHLKSADVPLKEFENKVKAMEQKMKKARGEADLFVKNFDLEIDQMIRDLRPAVSQFIDGIPVKLKEWYGGYECSVKIEYFHPKRTAEAIGEEFNLYLKRRYEQYTITWSQHTFLPLVQEGVAKVSKKMEKWAARLSESIKDIRVGLSFEEKSSSVEITSTGTKVGFLLYGLVTQDWLGALMGGALGGKAMLRTVGYEFCAGFAVGLIALFTPVGIGMVVLAAIGAASLAYRHNVDGMKNTVCEKILREYQSMFQSSAKKEELEKGILDSLKKRMEALKKEAKKAAYADLNQIEKDVQVILAEKKDVNFRVEKRKEDLRKYIAMLEAMSSDLEAMNRNQVF